MKKKVYVLQKEYKRGSKLCWECEAKSYDYDEILDKFKKNNTKDNKHRIKTITE